MAREVQNGGAVCPPCVLPEGGVKDDRGKLIPATGTTGAKRAGKVQERFKAITKDNEVSRVHAVQDGF